MKKIIPLIFAVFYITFSNGQAVGGWGNCEFATVATMNAFDPSTNAYDCKKVFVQATNEHYYWDGTQWVLDNEEAENIYNTDGTLTADRTMTMDGKDLTFDGSTNDVFIESTGKVGIGTTSPSQDLDIPGSRKVQLGDFAGSGGGKLRVDIADGETEIQAIKTMVLRTSGSNYAINGTAAGTGATQNTALYGWASGGTSNFGLWVDNGYGIFDDRVGIGTKTPDAQLDVEGGTVRFSDYGTGANTGTTTYLLAVDTDGDVIEEDLTNASGTGAMDNIYSTDGTIQANRTVDLDGKNLTFEGTNDFFIENTGNIGIGTTSPNGQLHAVNDENENGFYFESGNILTGEKDVFTIEDKDVGGGGQDKSSVLKVFKSANINTGDLGTSLIETTYTGANPGDNKYWISGRRTDEGAPEWGINISDNEIWSKGGILLNASSVATGVYSGGNFIVESGGDVGIGTITPDAKLDVENGTVRFSDYGAGTNTGTETRMLAVDTDGDVIEMNTVKSAKIFYPPAIAVTADAIAIDLTLDLHQQYVTLFGSPAVTSTGAPGAIPTYGETELYYYVTDYDTNIFENVSINANGVMEYDVKAVPSDNCSFINVVFVVK